MAVPNGSFETPVTQFVTTQVDAWEKTPKPFWYDEIANGPWDQLTGIFLFPDPGQTNSTVNTDGRQGIFLFAVPEVGIFQDYDSIGSGETTPSHAFDARFEVGKSYRLLVGVARSSAFPMPEGTTLEASLFYRDAEGERITVASNIVISTAAFPSPGRLADVQVEVPVVQATDPWADRHIGVQFLSTVKQAAGGIWELDNVRLVSQTGPELANPKFSNGQMVFTLQSEPGSRFEILSGTDLGVPLASWSSVGTVTNARGTTEFVDPTGVSGTRFYRLRQLP
jgi:hypothetical protein